MVLTQAVLSVNATDDAQVAFENLPDYFCANLSRTSVTSTLAPEAAPNDQPAYLVEYTISDETYVGPVRYALGGFSIYENPTGSYATSACFGSYNPLSPGFAPLSVGNAPGFTYTGVNGKMEGDTPLAHIKCTYTGGTYSRLATVVRMELPGSCQVTDKLTNTTVTGNVTEHHIGVAYFGKPRPLASPAVYQNCGMYVVGLGGSCTFSDFPIPTSDLRFVDSFTTVP